MATILYFGALPDLLDKGVEKVVLPESVHDAAGLLTWLSERGGNWRKLSKGNVRMTVNRHFAKSSSRVTDRDEVAIMPIR